MSQVTSQGLAKMAKSKTRKVDGIPVQAVYICGTIEVVSGNGDDALLGWSRFRQDAESYIVEDLHDLAVRMVGSVCLEHYAQACVAIAKCIREAAERAFAIETAAMLVQLGMPRVEVTA